MTPPWSPSTGPWLCSSASPEPPRHHSRWRRGCARLCGRKPRRIWAMRHTVVACQPGGLNRGGDRGKWVRARCAGPGPALQSPRRCGPPGRAAARTTERSAPVGDGRGAVEVRERSLQSEPASSTHDEEEARARKARGARRVATGVPFADCVWPGTACPPRHGRTCSGHPCSPPASRCLGQYGCPDTRNESGQVRA